MRARRILAAAFLEGSVAVDLIHAWRAVMSRPDAMLLDLGARGEHLLAHARLAVAVALLAWPLARAWDGAPAVHVAAAFGLVFTGIVGSLLLLLRLQRSGDTRRMAMAATAFDVAMAAACIAALVVRDAAGGLNHAGAWSGLLAAVAATALRADARTTVAAGLMALATVPVLLALAWAVHGPDGFTSLDHGVVGAGDFVVRVLVLAGIVALVAAGQHRMRRLVEVSGTDSLTGLPNRTWLLQRMPQLLERVQSDGGGLTVALVDLDHVRRLNHDQGHQSGDRALLALASALRTFTDSGDWLVRLAGGEFLLVVRQPAGTTWERLDALRRLFSERAIDGERGQPPLHASFSAGLAAFPHDGRDLSHLLRRADDRLQLARDEGRNKVIARG